MAATQQISLAKPAAPFGWLQALMVKVNRYRLYSQTVSELSALSGRELSDLGLSRSDIKRVAYQAAYEHN
ncbi:DUF1127 domain-containing protein [Cribrihabitans neustonicus]|uniref:DUF1127 domain-containing protein n=1 Tax=Cribrihabitans neustonicus TaxID=1429085 RepID=UPI003B5AD0FD